MSGSALLRVEHLDVSFGAAHARKHVVKDVSFTVGRGECLALVGESGSGKSVTARTLIGLTGQGAQVTAERLEFDGHDLRRFSERDWRRTRGAKIGFVLQDALASLDALRKVGAEIAEPLRAHARLTRRERDAEVLRLLELVGVPAPEVRAAQYPHQLSGGLRQRALIASAIAVDPHFLIADEPTTALDATIAARIIGLLGELKAADRGMLLVSHDLAVVAALADRIAVMRQGEIVEEGPAAEVLADPRHPYTRDLLAAVPSLHPRGARLSRGPVISVDRLRAVRRDGDAARVADVSSEVAPTTDAGASSPVIRAEGLTKSYVGPDRVTRTVVDGVGFEVAAGRTLGIVGESGSGKTTTARIVLGVETADAGRVFWKGTDWTLLPADARRTARRSLQAVYQDPLASFDPRYTVGAVLGEALEAAEVPRGSERADQAAALLDLVRLPTELLRRRPIELSGGQRQRVAIARALAASPEVLVCDEPVSALDVSVQAQVLDLLAALQEELGLTYLFISHDLSVVHHISDSLIVMKDGVIVEHGDADAVFADPRDPYTRELLAAVPRLTTIPLTNGVLTR
ncbi:ABC transporter ATP-binding protein [Agromyces protaetiae]|uniref:ABC transporter ATP-binding protein n=1 Tax=Agromyces protaetiae TaxID=2509455 RepID=A0A4P6FE38_9MICO|nr:ABC transporter ATP-binding protein [Agromyces protaetiae]QAY72659.1 ABC transporter ATP-binding protein [Agromyces protaetiae]